MPDVSVIIPNYNHAKFLGQRIESVLQQTYQDFEVIILDDCSTDNSRDVIERYRHCDKVAAVLYNEQNSGSPFKQWQKGIAAAKGQWIWIAESDDYNDACFLEQAQNELKKNPSAALFFCQSNMVNGAGEVTGDMRWWIDAAGYNWSEDFSVSGKNFAQTALLKINPVSNASGVVFRKSPAVFKYLKRASHYSMCGDWLFWSYIIKDSSIVYSAKKLNYFRFHDNTTRAIFTHRKNLRRLVEEIAVKEKIKKMYLLSQSSDIDRLKTDSLKEANIRSLVFIGNLVRTLQIPRPASYLFRFLKWSVKNRLNRA